MCHGVSRSKTNMKSNPFTVEQVQKLMNFLQNSSNHNVNQIHSHNGESSRQESQIGKI